ncbi:hypothetical protein T05_1987 [Trichinella murrelli]|uniref:Uncharacterized protein n=1 Tax=Trichinella murrelli TaxID=144512 RepID=A0A0V0TTR8_9BILA|nr:hypothetical protein T05_1987 [Trichinella murrelli]
MKSDCGSLDIRVKAVDVCWSSFRSFNVPSSRADLMLPSKDSQSSFKARGRWEYLRQWFSNFSGLRPSFVNEPLIQGVYRDLRVEWGSMNCGIEYGLRNPI